MTKSDEEIYAGLTQVKTADIMKLKKPFFIPSYTSNMYEKYLKDVNVNNIRRNDEECNNTSFIITKNNGNMNPDSVGYRESTEEFSNEIFNGDVDLGIKQLPINKRAKTKKSAMLKIGQRSGLGTPKHISLWNSGYWITIKPLDSEQIINLELELLEDLVRVGKQTNTLIYTHYNVIFAKVIFKYFEECIIDSSLNTEGNDHSNFISLNDMYTIALSLGISLYPKGFNAIVPCKNAIMLNEKGVPKCSYQGKFKLHLSALHRPNKDMLTEDHIEQMSSRGSKSVSIDDVIKYQDTLPNSRNVTKVYPSEDELADDDTTIVYSVPTLERYFTFGNAFIESLEAKCVNVVQNNKEFTIEKAESLLIESIKLQTISHFVDNIPVDDINVTDYDGITEALGITSSSAIITSDIIKDILEFIDKSQVVIVGIPAFECPNCNSEQTDRELIPLPVYDYFFTLLHSRYEIIIRQLIKRKAS